MISTGPKAVDTSQHPVSVNTWSFYHHRLAGEPEEQFWPRAMAAARHGGFTSWEPGVVGVADLERHAIWASDAGLELTSAYHGAKLHTPAAATTAVATLGALAAAGSRHGMRILVVNADPDSWVEHRAKTDAEIRTQVAALREAGQEVARHGVQLAYHWHLPEFLNGATEANHMMLATDPAQLALCLDVHWTWQSCAGSNVAVENALLGYRERIVELHLRQSHGGVWDEALGSGDVEYGPVVQALAASQPLLVAEQAPAPEAAMTMDLTDAAQHNADWIRTTFGSWPGITGAA